MSYHYYAPFIDDYCSFNFERPRILEIGVSSGIMLIALTERLTQRKKPFQYDGIDVKHDQGLISLLTILRRNNREHTINYLEHNSLALLPTMVEGLNFKINKRDISIRLNTSKFLDPSQEYAPSFPDVITVGIYYDIILIDGDHNYFTVKKELEYIQPMTRENTLIICDDYNTGWAEEDMFYATRSSHEELTALTPVIKGEKRGVRAAVDDFLKSNPQWKKIEELSADNFKKSDDTFVSDACVLYHEDNTIIKNVKQKINQYTLDNGSALTLSDYILQHRCSQTLAATMLVLDIKTLEHEVPSISDSWKKIEQEIDSLQLLDNSNFKEE